MNETMSELLNGIDGMTSEWMKQGQNVIRLMKWDRNERLEWMKCHFLKICNHKYTNTNTQIQIH